MTITSLRLPTLWRPAQIEIEDISKIPLEIISSVKNSLDCCIDQDKVTLLTENETLRNSIKDLKKKAIKGRFITTVSEGNISSCKQLMKFGEVFHNDDVRGAFQIADGTNYLCYITGQEQEQQSRID